MQAAGLNSKIHRFHANIQLYFGVHLKADLREPISFSFPTPPLHAVSKSIKRPEPNSSLDW